MKKLIHTYKNILKLYPNTGKVIPAGLLVLLLALTFLNIKVLLQNDNRLTGNAQSLNNEIEPESGTFSGNITIRTDPNASGGMYTLIGGSVPSPTPAISTPPPTIKPTATPIPGTSDCDPARNDLTTGSDRDTYDCMLISQAKKYGHPSPRILKSQIEWESHFDIFATSGDSPCGIHSGWTDAESKSFGVFQITPACGEAGVALLSNGHPNLTKDKSASLWTTSIFNPSVNIDLGAKFMAQGYNYFKQQFPGCTENQYVLMAAAGYVQDWDTIVGCNRYTDSRQTAYINAVLNAYNNFAAKGGWPNFIQ